MISRLLLIRHAETEAVREKLLVGSTDVDARPEGLANLDRFDELLREYSPAKWYCSPMKRTLQTAERIGSASGLYPDLCIDDRLREIDFGRWEMRSFQEIAREEPELVEEWARYSDFSFPGGERIPAFQGRITSFFAELQGLPCEEVCVIAHGGVIRTLICLALGLDMKNYLLFTVKPGSLTVLDLYTEGGVLTGLNL